MSARANQKVCFVGGAGHSGSTLLGIALGSHPSVFYAGEARKSLFLGDERKPLRKRVCKVCGPECPVWGHLDRREGEDLYEALSRRTGRPIVVDSTKLPAWIEEQTTIVVSRGVAVHLIYLARDGRAVLASQLRKYPDVSAHEHAQRWVKRIAETDALVARFPGGVSQVRYEDFATRPEEILRTLAGALGLEWDPQIMDPWHTEQHPLGGNAGTQSLIEGARTQVGGELGIAGEKRAYYENHPRGFVLDQRWRRELDPQSLATFDAVAGEVNARFAWDLP